MNLRRSVKRSRGLLRWFNQRIDGVEIKTTLRGRLIAASLDIALEHQRAIVTLISSRKADGSAFALLRLLFETYVRGVWLHHCASDQDLQRVKRDKLKKEFGALIADLERCPPFAVGVLSTVKRRSWRAMNSYTHSGYLQLVRRNTATTIEANYTEDEVLEVLDAANVIGFWAAVAIADLAGDVALANRILQKGNRFLAAKP